MSVNKVILVGNVGLDPKVRYLDKNTPVCNLRIATSETYRNKNGENVTSTEWHNVVLWRGLAEIAEKYVKKGSQLYIEGKLRTRAWDDKDNNKRYTTEIVADVMQMLGRRDEQAAAHDGTEYSENNFRAGKGAETENFPDHNINTMPQDMSRNEKADDSDSGTDDLPF